MTRGAPIPDTVTLHVPFRIVKRGGRKEMQLPEGAAQPRRTDSTLVKALARAFRWKRMLESGEFATIAELAEREGIAPSYMTRVLRLTLLAPDIVEAILDGRQGPEVTLARVLEPFPVEWGVRAAAIRCRCAQRSLCRKPHQGTSEGRTRTGGSGTTRPGTLAHVEAPRLQEQSSCRQGCR
jgi:hypothetical protein